MYLPHYRLKENPFQISTNPAYLWLGEKHREALATLRYGIEDNKGFLLLTGDVGTGKTTLINTLIGSLDAGVVAATVPDPGLDQLDLFYFIAAAFGIDGAFTSKGQFLVLFRRFLLEADAAGKKVLLIIDEAQRLTPELLEEIRLLSNIELPDRKLINIFFVGQNEFNSLLLRVENRAIRQRITVSYDIRPLTARETWEYIRHRLRVAGADREIFTAAAVAQIHGYSRGYPRLINVIADRALLTGFVEEVQEIGPKIVLECAAELRIPAPTAQEQRYVEETRRQLRQTLEQQQEENGVEEEAVAQAAVPAAVPPPAAAVAPANITAAVERQGEAEPVPGGQASAVGRRLGIAALLLLAAAGSAVFLYPRQAREFSDRFAGMMEPLRQRMSPAGRIPAQLPPLVAPIASPAPTTVPAAIVRPDVAPPPLEPDPLPVVAEGQPAAAVEEAAPAPIREAAVPPQPAAAADPAPVAGAGATVEQEASPQPGPELDPGFLDQRQAVGFAYDDNTLGADGIAVLDRLVEHLEAFPYEMITVNGYSDALGVESYNRKLSRFRADLVRGYLLGKGIPVERITVVGRGSAEPVAGNDTAQGRQRNRRVEIVVSR
ncbi:MAG: AAA family ATPase [Thermodesulfobacteriota bacterium]